ncbi:AMP-binding protein [uncultured Chitinophaga sp.]|uniref:AMP-binding protein n=1 Tax=uncultured Chitinophaga sp. TaxID=339340 RepID=UPI00263301C6|nr:AMP-binding protein [uncultured Chitinophaga sp.]
MDTNIIRYLIKHTRAFPHKHVFIVLGQQGDPPYEITYSQLETRVKQLAIHLVTKQLETRAVLLVYQDMLSFIIAFLACEYAGIVPVPVPYAKGSKQLARINGIITDAHADTILCTADTVDELQAALPAALRLIATDIDIAQHADDANLQAAQTEIAFIQYTSGSVGNPKGVVVTGHNLLHNQQLIRQTFGCDENSVIFSWLPFHHDMGLIGNVLHTIYTGCTCVLMPPLRFMQQPKAWLEGIAAYKVTHSGGPNFAFDLCVERIPAAECTSLDLSSWKVAYNGSEPVHASTIERFSRHFSPAGFNANAFTPCYGLAEATLLVSAKSSLRPLTVYIDKQAAEQGRLLPATQENENAKTVVSAGKPADGMKVKIVSLQDQRECAELEEGEICISGASVSSGYWNKNNDTLFYVFGEEHFLRTGDLGFLYQGELFVHGRVKEMLIVRGKNYYPYDIEQAIASAHEAIETNGVAVFALDDDDAIVVVAELRRSHVHIGDPEAIIAAINSAVSGQFGIDPRNIILTTPLGIPRTTSGKLQRIKCRTHYLENTFKIIASKAALAALQQGRERNALLLPQLMESPGFAAIKAYVADLIEVKTGSPLPAALKDETDLMALGVDSLRAMEIINTINQELGISLDAAKIYQHNTLLALCNTVEALLWLKMEPAQSSGKEITI